jgi:hypothetical protein
MIALKLLFQAWRKLPSALSQARRQVGVTSSEKVMNDATVMVTENNITRSASVPLTFGEHVVTRLTILTVRAPTGNWAASDRGKAQIRF